MNLERYEYFSNHDFKNYEFYSIGLQGHIKKGVRFSQINDNPIIYNLGFGDISKGTNSIDDLITTNNDDKNLVLATVANTILDFTNHYDNCFIFATGSTAARTRLYQIGIAGLWEEISVSFEVFGFKNDSWQAFQKNINYEAFLVRKK